MFSPFFNSNFFGKYLFPIFIFTILRGAGGERSERLRGVGERSEPPAGGLAQVSEGGVSASYLSKAEFSKHQENISFCKRNCKIRENGKRWDDMGNNLGILWNVM